VVLGAKNWGGGIGTLRFQARIDYKQQRVQPSNAQETWLLERDDCVERACVQQNGSEVWGK